MHPFTRLLRDETYRRIDEGPEAGSFTLSASIPGGSLTRFYPDVLFYVDAPTLDADELPDGESITYTLTEGNDLQSPSNESIIATQTGSGGKGSIGRTFAVRPKLRGGQLFGLRIDATAGARVKHAKFGFGVALT
jgi:hypothetical protein